MTEVRSFIAIEIPETVIARLAALQQVLRGTGAAVSWVRPEGIHITLKFLGNVPEARLPEIAVVLDRIASGQSPFAIAVAGTGAFPTPRRPRTVWAGITEGAETLGHLARDVDAALATLGFPRETRPFAAHVTLGRVKAPEHLARLMEALAAHARDDFGTMSAGALTLFRSDLTPKGATYTALHRAPLTSSAVP